MKISKKRIRSAAPYLKTIPAGQEVVVGLLDADDHEERIAAAGFTVPLVVGQRALPSNLGTVSSYNADGKYVPQKDQPMETATRQIEWSWTEFHGPYEIEQTRITDVSYKRYPRKFFPPPSLELTVATDGDGAVVVVADAIANEPDNDAALTHAINLLLELFGEAEILDHTFAPVSGLKLKRVNWTVLPPGEMPWAQLEQQLKPVVERMAKGNRPPAYFRTEILNQMGATFHAVGQAGFSGYIVFGWPDKKLYLFESLYYGNATYVVGEDWQKLSQMTKAEIIAGDLHKDRVIHNNDWEGRVGDWVSDAE
jgi:hypothetical protein